MPRLRKLRSVKVYVRVSIVNIDGQPTPLYRYPDNALDDTPTQWGLSFRSLGLEVRDGDVFDVSIRRKKRGGMAPIPRRARA